MQKAMNEFMIIAAIGKKDLLQANIDGKGSRPADMQLPDVGLWVCSGSHNENTDTTKINEINLSTVMHTGQPN